MQRRAKWLHLTGLLLGTGLFIGCPTPPIPQPPEAEIHLLDLDRGKMVTVRRVGNETPSLIASTFQPPDQLDSPKAVMIAPNPSGAEFWVHFLEVPGGVPSYRSYRYNLWSRTYQIVPPVAGPLAHPGGRITWLSADAGLGFAYLAWGTAAPFLVGYQIDSTGHLSPWTFLPDLAAAPVAVALRNDLLCLGAADGTVNAYRLKPAQAPETLLGLAGGGSIQALGACPEGLLVLRQSPATLDLYALDAAGLGAVPLSSIPVTGTPSSMEVMPRGQILVTGVAPQSVTLFGITTSKLEQRDLLVAIRNDFTVLKPSGRPDPVHFQLLLDGPHGQAGWMTIDLQSMGLTHLSIPVGSYAPVQIGGGILYP